MSTSTLGPYSKVTALTQGMINNAFKALYVSYPPLSQQFTYTVPTDKLWSIELKFLPVRLAIFGDGRVFLWVRISSGTIKIGQDDAATSVPMQDWEIFHPIDSNHLLTQRKAEDLVFFDLSVVQGDLSMERMLGILLAYPQQGLQPDFDLSKCVVFDKGSNSNKTLSWREWAAIDAPGAASLAKVLILWPQRLAAMGYNFLGLRTTLPQAGAVSPGYQTENRLMFLYPSSAGKGSGLTTTADNNSILVCSSIESPDPAIPFDHSRFSGNYLSEALSAPGSDVLNGYWTINSRSILEQGILPHLWMMNKATELQVQGVVWNVPTDGGKHTYQPIYGVRQSFASATGDLTWKEHQATSSVYDFEREEGSGSATSWSPHLYKWTSSCGPFPVNHDVSGGRKSQIVTSAVHSSAVEFVPGKNLVKAKFDSVYKFSSDWTTTATGQIPGRCAFDFRQSWTIDMNIVLVPTSPSSFRIKVTSYPSTPAPGETDLKSPDYVAKVENLVIKGSVEPYEIKQTSQLQTFALTQFKPSVINACQLFKKNIESELFWSTPEDRWMAFQNPILNNVGDLVVGINYKPPVYSSSLLEVADLSIQRPRPQPPPAPEPEKPSKPKNTLRLQWSSTVRFPTPARDKLQIDWTITNTTGQAISPGYVEIFFQSARQGTFPFSALRFPTITDKVVASSPTSAKVVVVKDASKGESTFRATVKFVGLAVQETLQVAISGSSKATAGQKFALEVSEAWQDAEDETRTIESHGTIGILIP